jgi:ATP-dependent DNA helicase RecG
VGTRATLQGQPVTIEGNLYDQIYAAVKTTVRLVEEVRLLGPSGLEEVRYPEVALHEIITNAVIHRDYSIADDIHVRIFDNRIEVASPGRLPAHITPSNILEDALHVMA